MWYIHPVIVYNIIKVNYQIGLIDLKKLFVICLIGFMLCGCSNDYKNRELVYSGKYPNFYNSVDDIFYTGIYAEVPNYESYILDLYQNDQVDKEFNLYDLASYDRKLVKVTSESIFNENNGMYLSNCIWEGLSMYDFLIDCGISDKSYVKISNKQGYYVVMSMEELSGSEAILALYLNGEELSDFLGFPVRFIAPGYFSEKQVGQVSRIEILDSEEKDFWELKGWNTGAKMKVNSKIFSPTEFDVTKVYDEIVFYGASYSPLGIDYSEISFDGGITWYETEVIKSDGDLGWTFWQFSYRFQNTGKYTILARAVDKENNSQPEEDNNEFDGINSYSTLNMKIIE